MTEPWSLERAARELAEEWFWPLDAVDVSMRIADFGREVERQTEARVRAEIADRTEAAKFGEFENPSGDFERGYNAALDSLCASLK